MIAAAQLIAFLLLLKYGITGASVWLRHGYDGAAFVFSREFPKALLEWKIVRGEKSDLAESKRLEEMRRYDG